MATDWRPIETAPKDGTLLLLWCGRRCRMGSFREDDFLSHEGAMWLDNSYDDFSVGFASVPLDPTYWMPLPASPHD